jgi:hypothetical protein
VGGAIGGYWAIGNDDTATVPASVMNTDSTLAKIGRSMKNRGIIGGIARVGSGSSSSEATW